MSRTSAASDVKRLHILLRRLLESQPYQRSAPRAWRVLTKALLLVKRRIPSRDSPQVIIGDLQLSSAYRSRYQLNISRRKLTGNLDTEIDVSFRSSLLFPLHALLFQTSVP